LQVASVLSGYCICFHTYVASVCSRCFICFRRMLHSSVSCCTRFMLFEESGGRGEPVASGHGAQSAGAGGRGHDGSGVRLRRQGEQMGWVRR
jgi:hypothetical protein